MKFAVSCDLNNLLSGEFALYRWKTFLSCCMASKSHLYEFGFF